MKRLLAASMLVSLAFPFGLEGQSAQIKASFFSGGKQHPLHIDKDHVVVRGASGTEARAAVLTETEHKRFLSMNLLVVHRSQVRKNQKIVGYPVWFHKKRGAVGVLTHEIVVRLGNGQSKAVIENQQGVAAVTETRFKKGLFLAKFTSPMKALQGAERLYKTSGVAYAHPNFLIPKVWRQTNQTKGASPAKEPLFSAQWHLENTGQFQGTPGADIGAKGAWGITTGREEVVVAVLDGGFEITHPDLQAGWRHNPGEIPGNSTDDDGNGYVDDTAGWNFYEDSADVTTGPFYTHGTAVAGLVGARHNGIGVTGVCPGCRMVPVVIDVTPVKDAEAFYYAKDQGAHIITNSWGYAVGTPTTDVVKEAITEVALKGRGGKGTLILFAMNNMDQDDCVGDTPDISSLDSVIAVSAASDQDKKVTYSAWGDCMEFLSPSLEAGRAGIATTDQTGNQGYNNGRGDGDLDDLNYTNDFGGTSAATPIAAGIFGLMLSINDTLTRDQALGMVLATADKVHPDLAKYNTTTGFSNKYGYGRINAKKAVRAAQVLRKYSKR